MIDTEKLLRERLDSLHHAACVVAADRRAWPSFLLELARTGFKHKPTFERLLNDYGVDPAAGGGQAFALAAVRGDVGLLTLLTEVLAERGDRVDGFTFSEQEPTVLVKRIRAAHEKAVREALRIVKEPHKDMGEDRFSRLCNRVNQQLRDDPACACKQPDSAVLDAATCGIMKKGKT